MYLQEEVGSLP